MPYRLVYEGHVQPEWIDWNGHMNDACYAIVFSRALDGLVDSIGLDAAGRARHDQTIFTLETQTRFLKEMKLGQRFCVAGRVIAHDGKRLHAWLSMLEGDTCAATSEQLILCVRIEANGARAVPFAPSVLEALTAITEEDALTPMPDGLGRGIAIRRR